jgi:diketogulonate reductase-like aldo/keto reductase
VQEGLVKAIGVSNFTKEQIEELLADSQVRAASLPSCAVVLLRAQLRSLSLSLSQTVPAVNQVEFHPYLVQQDLLDYCHAKGRLTCTLTFV